jgi:DNA-binding transcriptional LysR family regulator
MDELQMLRAFVAATQHRSFSKAAESLGVTTGAISKAIAKLEERIQTRLLHRTTRSITLTDAAQAYYQSCSRLIEELDEAHRRVKHQREIDSGRLRLAVHPGLVSQAFSRFVSDYHSLAPNVNLQVSVKSRAVNLYDGQFDMAILPTRLVEQQGVIRRTLYQSASILVASPRYLDKWGTPQRLDDLSAHYVLVHPDLRQSGSSSVELLEHGRPASVIPMSSIDGDEVLLRVAALAGIGIATLPETMVRDDLPAGELMPVLPHCAARNPSGEICLIYSDRKLLPARSRTFVDFCVEFFRAESLNTRADQADATNLSQQRLGCVFAASNCGT